MNMIEHSVTALQIQMLVSMYLAISSYTAKTILRLHLVVTNENSDMHLLRFL